MAETYSSAVVRSISFFVFNHSGLFVPYPRHSIPSLLQFAHVGLPSSHRLISRQHAFNAY